MRESTAILGKGGDIAPFPRPLTLLEDARTLLRKRKLCPNNLCHLKGSPQNVVNISRTMPFPVGKLRLHWTERASDSIPI